MKSGNGLRDTARRSSEATVRDRAANALVLGFAGMMWFGWAQQGPPALWAPWLIAGSVVSVVVAIAAAVLTRRHHAEPSAMDVAGGRRSYLRVVGLEVMLITLGAAVLGVVGQAVYISPWVLFVVGVHFLPLGRLFRINGLRICGGLVSAVAVVAALVGLSGELLPSAVAGAGGGLLMVAFGAHSLHGGWRDQMDHPARRMSEALR